MTAEREFRLRLDWSSGGVIASMADDFTGSVDPSGAPVSIGPNLFGGRSHMTDQGRGTLGRALFPSSVRARLLAELSRIDRDGVIRLRIGLPADAPHSLGALLWEEVLVPRADAATRPDTWRHWISGGGLDAGSGIALGRDPRFSLVRDVSTRRFGPAPGAVATNRVVIAGAASVSGVLPDGMGTVPVPTAAAINDADIRAVAAALIPPLFTACVLPMPASAQQIRAMLPGALAFYFGGHHVGGGLVVAGDPGGPSAAFLPGTELSRWLVQAGVPLVVLMACDSAGASEPGQYSLAEQLARDGIEYVVAVNGLVRDGQSARFAGAFMAALGDGRPVDMAVRTGADELRRVDDAETVPILYTSVAAARGLDLRGRLPRRPSNRPSDAYRLRADRRDGRLRPPDEWFRCRLETLWCLTPDGFCDVLADAEGDDVVDLLERSELLVHGSSTINSEHRRTPRRWYAHDALAEGPPRHANGFLGSLWPNAESPERPSGLVIRVDAAEGRAPDWAAYLAQARRFLPGLYGVVLQVHGRRADIVRDRAEAIARELGRDEFLLRQPPPPAAAPRRRVRDGVPPESVLERVSSHVNEAWDEVHGPWNEPPQFDPAAFVAGLERTSPGEVMTGEAELLGRMSSMWPQLFWTVATAHASGRCDRARFISLRLAAADDELLHSWLRAAERRRFLLPSDITGVETTTSVNDAVVLALVRRHAHASQVDAWMAAGVSQEVATAVSVSRRGTPVTVSDLERSRQAVALDRAGLLEGVDPRALDPRGGKPGSWALLARRPLAEDDVVWLSAMDHARKRLVGLCPPVGDVDFELDDQLAEFRWALRPPTS